MSHDLFDSEISHGPSTQAYWDGQSIYAGTAVGAAPDDAQVQWSKLNLVFTRTTPTSIVDDVMTFGIAYVLDALSYATSVISSGQKAAIEALWNTWWAAEKGFFPSHITLSEYRWHDYLTSWTKPGPATRVTSVASVATGTSTTVVPDQVASSVTFKTASRLHWGRIYLPQFITTNYTSTGRITTAQCDGRLAALRTCLLGASTAGTPPVVTSSKYGGVLAIKSLQMDNTPDVVRRRRAKHPEYRKEYTS